MAQGHLPPYFARMKGFKGKESTKSYTKWHKAIYHRTSPQWKALKERKSHKIAQGHKWKALKEMKSLKATLNDTENILGPAAKVFFYTAVIKIKSNVLIIFM